jgi:nitrilase
MRDKVKVACVQAEPAVFDRDATLDRIAVLTVEAAGQGAELVVFPETFVSVYPSSVWARALAGWGDPRAKEAFALLADSGVEIPGPAADRLGEIARENGVWLVVGVNELDPRHSGTVYNALLYFDPDGQLALKHRKLVPTNHERLVWGPGDGGGLRAIETPLGRIGGLICWENYMPLARFSLYESGERIHLAPTADASEGWQATIRHIALEGRVFVLACNQFVTRADYPADFELKEALARAPEVLCRGGSAIVAPDGSYLAEPLYGREGILTAELDLGLVTEGRQLLDVAGHYARPDVFRLETPAPAWQGGTPAGEED